MRSKTIGVLAFGVVALVLATPSWAQEDWKYSLAPYVWIAGLDGEVTARGVTAPVEANFSDIIDNLEAGALLHFEAARGDWTVFSDLIFLGLGQTAEGRLIDVDVDVDQLILELGGGYALSDSFEVLFGGRYIDIDVQADLSGPLAIRIDGDQSWVDPFVGGRYQADIAEKWWFNLRGDVGGFGIGSDFTWNFAAHLVYRLKASTALALGYRILDIDYEDGEMLQRFAYDADMSGPQIGLEFKF